MSLVMRACRGCGRPVIWLKTNGTKPDGSPKLMPVNAESVRQGDESFDSKRHKSHFADCPNANDFRKKEVR